MTRLGWDVTVVTSNQSISINSKSAGVRDRPSMLSKLPPDDISEDGGDGRSSLVNDRGDENSERGSGRLLKRYETYHVVGNSTCRTFLVKDVSPYWPATPLSSLIDTR